jgi:hypothetical protein
LSEKNIDRIKDHAFVNSNKMFKAMIVQLKREEQGGIDHHPPIEADDLKKIYSTLKTTDPTSIQQKVFIDIMLYFGRRGRENLRNLKVDDFQVGIKQGGGDVEHRFVYIQRDELTKNHQTYTNTTNGKMFEVKGMLGYKYYFYKCTST